MPITEQMFAILEQGKLPQQAIEDLMTRAARAESY
jgi:glycerol-3-phosphate dehydrogenase